MSNPCWATAWTENATYEHRQRICPRRNLSSSTTIMEGINLSWTREKSRHTYAPVRDLESPEGEQQFGNDSSRWKNLLRLLQPIATFLLGVSLASAFFLIHLPPADRSNKFGVASDLLPSPVPPIPLTTVTFEENTTFSSRPTPETDQAWNQLLPVSPVSSSAIASLYPASQNMTDKCSSSPGEVSSSLTVQHNTTWNQVKILNGVRYTPSASFINSTA